MPVAPAVGRKHIDGACVTLASNRCKLLSSRAMVVSVAVNVGNIPAGEVERGDKPGAKPRTMVTNIERTR